MISLCTVKCQKNIVIYFYLTALGPYYKMFNFLFTKLPIKKYYLFVGQYTYIGLYIYIFYLFDLTRPILENYSTDGQYFTQYLFIQ